MTHRPATLFIMTVAVAVMAGTMSPNALPSLIWNASESAPSGFTTGSRCAN
jgi:type IV secretory pathway protease TraF